MKNIKDEINDILDDENVIFKKKLNRNNYKKWAKIIVSLANSEGGSVYFGILKNGDIVGLDKIEKDAKYLEEILKNNIIPTPDYVIYKNNILNKMYLCLDINKSDEPTFLQKKDKSLTCYIRKNNKTIPLDYEGFKQLFKQEEKININKPIKYEQEILEFCKEPRKRKEIQEHIGISSRPYFRQNILIPLIEKGLLISTNPNPRASNQKYVTKTETISSK